MSLDIDGYDKPTTSPVGRCVIKKEEIEMTIKKETVKFYNLMK